MIEKRILDLSPVGKKLGGPYRAPGGHLGVWALEGDDVCEKSVINIFFHLQQSKK